MAVIGSAPPGHPEEMFTIPDLGGRIGVAGGSPEGVISKAMHLDGRSPLVRARVSRGCTARGVYHCKGCAWINHMLDGRTMKFRFIHPVFLATPLLKRLTRG